MFSPAIMDKFKEWKTSPVSFVHDVIDVQPTGQQLEYLHSVAKEKRITIRSGHGCHTAGTQVHMFPYGFKNVEDVKVGDLLMGQDSKPRRVLELYTGEEDLCRIEYKDGTYYEVNKSHKLALVCTGSKGQYKTGDKIEISVRDFLSLPKNYHNRFACYKVGIDYPEISVMIDPYILGLWLGDGSHNQLELTNIDKEIIAAWEYWGKCNGLSMTTTSEKLHRLTGDKSAIQDIFSHYNLWGNKHVPLEYIYNSKKVRLQLLAGLIDTDGYADKRNNSLQYQIIQKRKHIAEAIHLIARSCGMHSTFSEKERSWIWNGERKVDVYYEVRISRNTDMIPTIIQRKTGKIKNKQRSNLHFGFTVKDIGYGKYYGFGIDKDHLYVLSDFTVTRNTGKDASTSWVIMWFMCTRPFAKVACTAPTARQLSDILWSELSKWFRKSRIADEFVIQKDKIFQKDNSKEWWCRAISVSAKASKEEQAETLAGLHGDHLLIVVDEASGVNDPVYIPLEGALTQEDNKVVLIGNMTKNHGYFHESHFHPKIGKMWKKLHWDSRKSENVTKEYVQTMLDKYGEDSNVFRIRVIGDPPLDDERTLIPLAWALQCIGNELEENEDDPLYLSADVARYGEDKSIVMPRKGFIIKPWSEYQKMSTAELGGHLLADFRELEADGIAIDEIGVGAGTIDWLKKIPEAAKFVFGVNVANVSSNPKRWWRLRDELWWRMRENCQYAKYSFPCSTRTEEEMSNELCNELSSLYYEYDNKGAVKVESKKQAKLRGIYSPNIADALGISEYFSSWAHKIFLTQAKKEDMIRKKALELERQRMQVGGNSRRSQSWMSI